MSMMCSNNTMSEFSSVTPQTRVFTIQDGVDAMTLCRNHVWIASQSGAIEVRNVHTGQITHAFQPALPSSRMQFSSTGNSRVSTSRLTTNRSQTSKHVNSNSSGNYSTYHHRYINNEQESLQEEVNRGNRIWVMLGVQNESAKQNQVWIGLSCGTIQAYHGSKYVLLRQMKKHLAGVHCLIDSPDGQYVFSGSSDFLIAQWKVYPVNNTVNDNNCLVRVFNGHTNYVRCLHAENGILFSGSDDGTVKMWDVESGCVKCSLTFHNNSTVSSTLVNTNNMYNSTTPNESHKVLCGVSALCRVGVNMWSGDDEGKVIIWQLLHYDKLYTVHAHCNRITLIRKIGGRVYSASSDGVICIHDAINGQVIQQVREHAGCAVMSLLCGVEIDRYYSWSIDNTSTIKNYCSNTNKSSNYESTNNEMQETKEQGLIRCWHHDEHVPMTRTREGFNDLRWYHSTHDPYGEVNKSLIAQQDKLEELVALTGGDDINNNNTQNRLHMPSELGNEKKEKEESIAASIWRLHSELKKLHKQIKEQRNKIRNEEEEVEIKEKEANLLQHQLHELTNAIARVKAEKNVLSTAPSTTSAITSSAPPPPPPPPPPAVVVPSPVTTTSTITPTSAPVTISVPIPTVIVPSMLPTKQTDVSSTLPTQNTVKPKSWLSSLHLDAPSRTSTEIKLLDETNKLAVKPLTENSASAGISGIALPVPAPQTAATSLQQPALPTWATGASQVTRGTSYEPNLATLPPPPPPVAIVPSAPTTSSSTVNKTRRLSL